MANIAHLGKYYRPDFGGIESVTISLANAGVLRGHSISVVCFKKSPASNEEVIDGVNVLRAPTIANIASQPLSLKYFMQCLKVTKNAEIVHLHAPNMLAALSTLFMGRKARLLVHWHSDVVNKGILGRILRPLETTLLRRADVIIVATPVYAKASVALRPFRDKVSVIPYGVKEDQHESIESKLERDLEDKLRDKTVIIAVGRLVPYKGFSVLIDAAKHLCHNSVVVIVGGGPLEKDLRQAIDDARVEDRVLLLGQLRDSEMRALFKKATLFCLPSTDRSEAFGVVLIEAMTYGLPIVASDIPGSGVPWVNKQEVSGLNVPVGDPIALAKACNQIILSPEVRMRLSEGARRRFASEFTEEVFVQRIMQLYERMLVS